MRNGHHNLWENQRHWFFQIGIRLEDSLGMYIRKPQHQPYCKISSVVYIVVFDMSLPVHKLILNLKPTISTGWRVMMIWHPRPVMLSKLHPWWYDKSYLHDVFLEFYSSTYISFYFTVLHHFWSSFILSSSQNV